MSDEPRNFGAIALHAAIIQEEARVAQHEHRGLDLLPGFTSGGQATNSRNLESSCRREPQVHYLPQRDDHIRFLEHVVERLACQVSDLAMRLAKAEPMLPVTGDIEDVEIDMLAVSESLTRKGYVTKLEHTGGGVATLYVGPTFRDEHGDERYAACAGPGTTDGWTASAADFYVGPDDDEADYVRVATGDAETIAVLVVAQVIKTVTARAGR